MRCLVTVLSLLASFAMAQPAQDWPHLRGPAYDGHVSGFDLHLPWPKEGPPVLWRKPLVQGYSGCIVVGDHVYTQYQNRSGQFLACLDLLTGETLWETRYGWPWQTDGDYPGPYATPTYHDGRGFFAGADGLIGCVDPSNGKILWSLNPYEKFKGDGAGFGYACTPLVENGKVLAPVGGKGASMVALDARNGSVLWQAGDLPINYSPALPITVGERRQVVYFCVKGVMARDPDNGRELWFDDWIDQGDSHRAAWLVYAEPYLLCASAFNSGVRVLKLTATGDRSKAEVAWKTNEFCNDVMSSVVLNGHVYGFNLQDAQASANGDTAGEFQCRELATGQVKWSSKATGHASVLATGDKLILLNEIGSLIVAEASPQAYRELARATISPGKKCWTAPAVSNGRILVRGEKELVCVYVGDPGRLPKAPTGAHGTARAQPGVVVAWLARYQDRSFLEPTARDFLRWYFACVGGVLVPAWVFGYLLRRFARRSAATGYGIMAILSLASVPIYTALAGRFLLTWPVLLLLGFVATLAAGLQALNNPDRSAGWRARLALVVFGGICLGFFALCNRYSFATGIGFLIGFIPAWPLAQPLARRILRGDQARWFPVWEFLAFTVYFWTSAAFVLWKNGAGF